MKTSTLTIAATVLLLNAAAAQINPFPWWMDLYLGLPASQLESLTPSAMLSVPTDLRPDTPWKTAQANFGKYTYDSLTSQGDIAVWEENPSVAYGGLASGLSNLLYVSRATSVPVLPSGHCVFLLAGIRSNGLTGVNALVAQGEVAPTNASVVPLPVDGISGEVFVTAGYVDGMIYVFEGTTGKIFRYIDTTSDGVPDTRDPSFTVSIYTNAVGDPAQIYFDAIRPGKLPGQTIACTNNTIFGGETYNYVAPGAGGGWEWRMHDANANPSTDHLPGFASGRGLIVSDGQDRVVVRGEQNDAIVVERLPSGASQWVTLSSTTLIMQTDYDTSVTLSSSVVLGEQVRVRSIVSGKTGLHVHVLPSMPVILGPVESVAKNPGDSLILTGDNLDGQIEVMLHLVDPPVGTPSEYTLSITSQAKHDVTVTIPAAFPVASGETLNTMLTVKRTVGTVTRTGNPIAVAVVAP